MGSFGVYVGNDPADLAKFDSWFGTKAGHVMHYFNSDSWKQFDDSIGWATNLWQGLDRPVLWSVPLITTGSTLEAAAQGAYQDHWRKAAEALAKTQPGAEAIYVRTGWEFNGDWFPWASTGKEEAFKEAFRDFVDTFRSVSDRFKFEWTPIIGHTYESRDPGKSYPGDKYVDVIGMDFYWSPQWDGTDPDKAWNYYLTREHGLQWHKEFANAHNKPMAYSEWGVRTDDATRFLQHVDRWFETNKVLYSTYWETDLAGFPGTMSGDRYPTAGKAFKDLFKDNALNSSLDYGDASGPSTPKPGPAPTPTPSPTPVPVSDTVANWLIGKAGDDRLTGTDRNDYINGAGGADTLTGGKGNDTYVVDQAQDSIIERAGEGVDKVESWVSGNYQLGANVENATLMGSYAQGLTGNGLANRIIGGAGNNTIVGGAGNDVLTGNGGRDLFVFGANGSGVDIITDFEGGPGLHDVIRIEDPAFTSFHSVKAAMRQTSEGTLLTLGDGDSVLLRGVRLDTLAADDFSY